MQIHGSEYRESLDQNIQRLYTGSLREFIIVSGKTKKDTRYEQAVILMTSLQQQRKDLYSPEYEISEKSQDILNLLLAYQGTDKKVTAVVASKEFDDLQKICRKIALVKK